MNRNQDRESQGAASDGPLQSMGFSTPDRIVVRDHDLVEDLIGKVDFTSMILLELVGRLPTEPERRLLDAVLVAITEHGITPSAIATRLTYMAAPESLQGAVAAGLLGAGGVFLGAMEGSARMLQSLVAEGEGAELKTRVECLVKAEHSAGRAIPGLGHPIHRPVDPRTPRLFELADDLGFGSTHREALSIVHETAEQVYGRELPINVSGAIGAVISDASLPWRICRGLAVIARSAGLVGHLMDEVSSPTGRMIWDVVDEALPYTPPNGDLD